MAGGGAAEKTGHYEGGLRGEWENGAEMRGLARHCGGGRGLVEPQYYRGGRQ